MNNQEENKISDKKELSKLKRKAYLKIYNQSEKRKQYMRDYYIKNKKKHNTWSKNYYQLNKDVIKLQHREYVKKRRKTNESVRLRGTLHSRLMKVIREHDTKKFFKTEELLGCSIKFLKHHLESQFKDGMSWENRGNRGWHIDHIRPCSSFDLVDPEEQKKCFHYTNLQPLWWWENLQKSDKITPLN